jgi:cob(I)alamin adenosyltransferase
MKRGYTHVYTGDGKGKTTAALGLVLRACGASLKVYIGQFMKCGRYCEIKALKKLFRNVTVEQYGRKCFVCGKPSCKDIEAARIGLNKLSAAMAGGKYDLIIADEANTAIAAGLILEKDILDLIRTKPIGVELVLTGRSVTRNIVKLADLVTEMKEIKHYYSKGVKARRGIEM